MESAALVRLAHGVIWPGFDGTTVPPWLARALEQGLAGVVLFGPNIDPDDPDQLRLLTDEIHRIRPAALVGADEEGGAVTRLRATADRSEPGNAALGRVDDVAATERSYARIGLRLRAAGVDVDLAPCADVNVNPRNPVIGIRSFGAAPALVARHTAAAIAGLQGVGVAACAKHFPGHGDTATDSHLGLPTVDLSLDELCRIHLPPFEAAVAAGARAVMTAHIRVPPLGDAPATLNPDAIRILRECGFDGVAVTDALDMAAVRASVGMGRGAVLALLAGADLLCVGNPANVGGPGVDERDYREVLDAVVAALASGELPRARVEEAVRRRDALVAWRDGRPAAPAPADDPADATDVAWRALSIRGVVTLGPGEVLLVDARDGAHTLAEGPRADPFGAHLAARRAVIRADAQDAPARAAAHPGEVVLISGQPQTNPTERAIRDGVLAARPDAVLVLAGWPEPGSRLPGRAVPGRCVEAWGSGDANARAVVEALTG